MRHTPERHADASGRTVKDIRRKTGKRYSSEVKIGIVVAGLRGDDTNAELCRPCPASDACVAEREEGIAQNQYYSWPKEFMVCLGAKSRCQISKVIIR